MDLFNLLSQDTTTTTTTPAATTTTSNSTTNATSNSTKNSTSNSTKNSTANATKPKPPPPRLFKFDDLPPRRPPKNQSGILNGYALGEECTPRFVLLSLMPNTILSNQWPFAADTQGVKIIMSSEYMD